MPDQEYFLRSKRLVFRCWSRSDLPLALSLWSDPQVTRLLGGPFSERAIQLRLELELANQAAHHVQYWPMFLQSTVEFVGCAGLRPYQPAERIYELGFHLCPNYWGQGLATEAARAIASYGFNTLHTKALFAGHHPENLASHRVLEKLGFQFTHQELYSATNAMHRSYLLTPWR